jgi:hypothetical protein
LPAGVRLAAITKPVFPLADTAFGRSQRALSTVWAKASEAPRRDAIVADVTPPALRDAVRLRQSLDTVGAFAGPLLAMLLLWLWADNMRAVL